MPLSFPSTDQVFTTAENLLSLVTTLEQYAEQDRASLWILDGGATNHMLQDRELVKDILPRTTTIQGAFGESETSNFCRVSDVRYSNFLVSIGAAIFNESLPGNILSFSRLLDRGFISRKPRLLPPLKDIECSLVTYSYEDHCKSGHILPCRTFCEACTVSKAQKSPHRATRRDTSHLNFNDHNSTDLCGPVAPESIDGDKYNMVMVDRRTRFTESIPMRQKSDSTRGFTSFYESPMNGGAEVHNRIIFAGGRTLLTASGLPKTLWSYAVVFFTFCLNIMPRKCLDYSNSHRERYGEDFNTARLATFGAECYYNLQKKDLGKLDPRRRFGYFVGFDQFSLDYQIYDPNLGKVLRRVRDVVFKDERQRKIKPLRPKLRVQFRDEVAVATFHPHERNNNFVDEITAPLAQEGEPPAAFPKDRRPPRRDAFSSSSVDHRPDQRSTRPRVEPPERAPGGLVYLTIPTPKTVRQLPTKNVDYLTSDGDDRCYFLREQTASRNTNRCTEEELLRYLQTECPDVDFTWHSVRHFALLAETVSNVQALQGPDAPRWQDAIQVERKGLEDRGFAVPLPPEQWGTVPKADVLPLRLILTKKEDGRFKARCVVLGNRQRNADSFYSPVARFSTLRLLLSLAARKRWDIDQYDISNAYVNAPLKTPIYVSPPPQWRTKQGEVWELKRALYGLKESGFRWYEYFRDFLLEQGWIQNRAEPCLFNRGGVCLLLYVDDLLLFGNQGDIDREVADILSKFECRRIQPNKDDKGILHRMYLGLHIHQDKKRGTIRVTQETLVQKILDEFEMANCNPTRTPAVDLRGISPEEIEKEKHTAKVNSKNCRKLVGMAMYLTAATRYDIAYAVKELGKYNDRNGPREYIAAGRLIRYLKGTKDFALVFRGQKSLTLDAVVQPAHDDDAAMGFSDADWGNSEDRRSTSGILIYFGGDLIFWQSITQKSAGLSSTEAEYYAISERSREILYYRNLLSEISNTLQIPDVKSFPAVIYEDNKSCIDLVHTPETTKKTKHIDIRYNFIKDLYQKGEIKVIHPKLKIYIQTMQSDCVCKGA
eukprot:g9416.t1